ncbi:hypothetical protein CHGG_03678 [Chaetomium globosum CBS 148.51]|uniref:Glucose-methanol-choline oxidoreductase N-terminal domain-containing protein n=1 Tax=Chaetomium globosum (strain ATCC 6205 / CBS 148.51 / DSM 1962 / NBRC 6347 / NRRL 1970) TaxID=306901 RepID=Q2H7X6_CHAGB|nr:uncharacterized protein CHGG_03678 [Chaetomium globosum CBS 148.51]EAQ91743.1 hypothetical protein CHGG_03678 [Chaetomium globosum CBS 148.51]
MGLYNKLPDSIQEVDVIIAGGNLRGCLTAGGSRPEPVDPDDRGRPEQRQCPNHYPPRLVPHPPCTWQHVQLILQNQKVCRSGRPMVWRGYASLFEEGDCPCTPTSLKALTLVKVETYHGKDEKGVHGHDGPIHVSRGTYHSKKVEDEFITSAAKVGWPEVEDVQDLESVNVVGRAYRYVSLDGKRQDAATCYLHPLLNEGEHPNLHVLVESQVKRVLFDKSKAVGVELRPNPAFGGSASDIKTVKARRLVVVSCGACGTPSLLERSGIGSQPVLQAAGVPVVAEAPGVGNGYEDHHLAVYPYLNSLDASDTLDDLAYGRMGNPEDLIRAQHPMLGWNAQEVQVKARPTDAEVAALGPEFKKAWDREFRDHPEKPTVIFTVIAGFPGDPSLSTGGPGLAISAFTVYPFSRGHIHITGPQLEDPVDFDTGFFADDGDLDIKKHQWTYKKQREIMRRMPSYRGEMAACHPPFGPGSQAASVTLQDGPLPADAPDIEYSADDDAVLERWLRENISTTWHSLGTCKMAPRDDDGVVDENLSVYGVEGLKIADLSIVPRNVAANTNNTALVIGEKAADIIIKELDLHSDKVA